MENETNKSVSGGKYHFRIDKNEIIVEFDQFNRVLRGENAINEFTKTLLIELRKFKKWEAYRKSMIKQPELPGL